MESDRTNKLIIITAPSGSGKTTIVRDLVEKMEMLSFSVSATTRKARANEIDGTDYFFLSIDDFKNKIESKEFAEYEMVYEGKYYGTLKSELKNIWNNNHFPLVDIDVHGALRLKKNYGQSACSIFIQAPSLNALSERLKSRGTETEEMLQERLAKAETELKFKDNFDHVVINDILEKACNEVHDIVLKFLKPQQ